MGEFKVKQIQNALIIGFVNGIQNIYVCTQFC